MKLALVVDILLARHAKRDLAERPYTDYAEILRAKEEVLLRFQAAFEPSSIDNLSAETFRDFLSFKHNKHWTGLQRSTSQVCDDMPKLRAALKYLFDDGISVSERIDRLTQKGTFSVPGISLGILTPLLLIRFPKEFGVWNNKAVSALRMLRIWPRFSRGATNGQKYDTLNTLLLQLSDETGLDLWSLDGLWHVINESCRIEIEKDFAQEVAEQREFCEGSKKMTSGFVYERDLEARRECIRHNGTVCIVCGFDFFKVFGELGLGFIHVHHVTDIAIQGPTTIDPKKDLAPVCPNCHAMLHKGSKPARSVEDLKQIIVSWREAQEKTT